MGDDTRTVRKGILNNLCAFEIELIVNDRTWTGEFGDLNYQKLRPAFLHALRNQRADTPCSMNNWLKAFRQVCKNAIQLGYIETNPAIDVPYLSPKKTGGHHTWTIEEVRQFEERHPFGTPARLALGLLLYAGCPRRSDVVLLGRQHVRNGRLRYTQYKNRNRNPQVMDIKVSSALQETLDMSPLGEMTWLVTSFKKPFSANGFGNWFKDRCVEAGLPHCSAHGVRKAAACRLVEYGLQDFEIMEQGGWKTLKEVQRYTKDYRRRFVADAGSEKIETGLKSEQK